MELNRALNPSVIKSIQSGSVLVSSALSTVAISAVNVSKSILIVNGAVVGTPSSYSSLGSVTAVCKIVDSVTLSFKTGGSVNAEVYWQLVEYL